MLSLCIQDERIFHNNYCRNSTESNVKNALGPCIRLHYTTNNIDYY